MHGMLLPLSIITGLIGLCSFLCGLLLLLFEFRDLSLSLGAIVFGLGAMSLSALIWLRLLPRRLIYALQSVKFGSSTPKRDQRQSQLGIVGILDINSVKNKGPNANQAISLQVNPDTTETLLKSIRGIPYLIQAIQYSMETNVMAEMGQSVIGSSVIHTAPGCSSVLDCDSEDDHTFAHSISPRLSGPEEQWENTDQSRWTNPQLKIALNRTSSSLNVFPYSESRPLDELNVPDTNSTDDLEGSAQSGLSRVTVSYNKNNQQEIRCIGMSSAFLSRFNNSFKT